MKHGPCGPVHTDTRSLRKGDWFLALSGDRFDGHDFLEVASECGCAGAVAKHVPEGWERGFIRVEDGLVALQALAKNLREHFEGPVVCITGSCGKTTAKEMTTLVLQAGLGIVHQTKGNLNNHVGVPLSILSTPAAADAMVLELGMSAAGEISLLTGLAQPSVRVVTNVGHAHIASFADGLDGVAKAKAEILEGLRESDVVVLNADDERVAIMGKAACKAQVKSFGTGIGTDIRILEVAPAGNHGLHTHIKLLETCSDKVSVIKLQCPGKHLAINAALAVAVGTALSVTFEECCFALQGYQSLGMRLKAEAVKDGNCLLLDDSYNANPSSTANALEVLANVSHPGRRIVALGDMLELGDTAYVEHEKILHTCLSGPYDVLAMLGPQYKAAAQIACKYPHGKILIFADTPEVLASQLLGIAKDGDVFLVKGSRSMRMDVVAHKLRGMKKL